MNGNKLPSLLQAVKLLQMTSSGRTFSSGDVIWWHFRGAGQQQAPSLQPLWYEQAVESSKLKSPPHDVIGSSFAARDGKIL